MLLRRQGKTARQNLTVAERRQASEIIAKSVVSSPWFRRSENIACYISTDHEVDTSSIIARAWAMKKSVFAPVLGKKNQLRFRELSDKSTLKRDHFDLWQPVDGEFIPPGRLDVVIAPLVCFDRDNNRIGMGGGYFDRTFSFLKDRKYLHHPKLVGLGFDCQKIEKIPANPWDVRLFAVVTNEIV